MRFGGVFQYLARRVFFLLRQFGKPVFENDLDVGGQRPHHVIGNFLVGGLIARFLNGVDFRLQAGILPDRDESLVEGVERGLTTLSDGERLHLSVRTDHTPDSMAAPMNASFVRISAASCCFLRASNRGCAYFSAACFLGLSAAS
jgi:hypothetical protein